MRRQVLNGITADTIQMPKHFPFHVGDSYGVMPTFQRLHWHSCHELNLIKSGSGQIIVNGRTLPLWPGDIIMIGGSQLHRHLDTRGLVMSIMTFESELLVADQRFDPDLLRPLREAGVWSPHRVERSQDIYGTLNGIFNEIEEEYQEKRPFAESLIRGNLIRFLAYLNRFGGQSASSAILAPTQVDAVKRVLLEIEQNLAHPWTISTLAELVHLSPSRFSTLFQSLVGVAPIEYLIQLRLSRAIDDLEASDDSVSDIADRYGFRTQTNFNRLFRKYVGLAPRQVRMRRVTRSQKRLIQDSSRQSAPS